jgi:hypothetical protein
MTVTVTSFRDGFPAFANTATFPDSAVNFWIAVAGNMLDPNQWGAMADTGSSLFIAHNLVLDAQANASAATPAGVPNGPAGALASKSVSGVSASYDMESSTIKGGGDFNLTAYGKRYLSLAEMFGAGGFQIC